MHIDTHNDAVNRRRAHRRILKRGNALERRVARNFSKCLHGHRCQTEACRVCLREFRLWWLGEAIRIIVQRPNWTRCSIISKGIRVRYGKLLKFDLNAEIKRIRKRLERSALSGRIVLGALDVSLNLENNTIQGWQWHVYLIVEGENDEVLREAIKGAFPSDSKALVPYDFQQIDHSEYLKVATYSYKALFKRRSGYTDSQGNHRTKDLPLKGSDLRMLLPLLAKHQVGARLILSGVRRNGQRLVFTTKKGSAANRATIKRKAA
jgi:hypothetical protein